MLMPNSPLGFGNQFGSNDYGVPQFPGMAGPTGFSGQSPGGMFGAPAALQDPQKKHNGMNPWLMMLSPMMGMMSQTGLGPLGGLMGLLPLGLKAMGAFGHHGNNSNG